MIEGQHCHSERSEASPSPARETRRCVSGLQARGNYRRAPIPVGVIIKITPTGHPACGLSSWLRLMCMRADKSAVCTINRHLQVSALMGINVVHAFWLMGID